MKLTAEVRKKILEQNEGFTTRTNYEGSNFKGERVYTIADGKLNIRDIGVSFLIDARYNREIDVDENSTKNFLCDYEYKLNLDGIS